MSSQEQIIEINRINYDTPLMNNKNQKNYEKHYIFIIMFLIFIIIVISIISIISVIKLVIDKNNYINYNNTITTQFVDNITYRNNCLSLYGGFYGDSTNCYPVPQSNAIRWSFDNTGGYMNGQMNLYLYDNKCNNTNQANNISVQIDDYMTYSWNTTISINNDNCVVSFFPYMTIEIEGISTVDNSDFRVNYTLPYLNPNDIVEIQGWYEMIYIYLPDGQQIQLITGSSTKPPIIH